MHLFILAPPEEDNVVTGRGDEQRAKARKVSKDNNRVTTSTGASMLDLEPVRSSPRSRQVAKDLTRAGVPPDLASRTSNNTIDNWIFRNTDIRYRGQQGQGQGHDKDRPDKAPGSAPSLIKAMTQVPPASAKADTGTYSQKGKGHGARKGGPEKHQLTLKTLWNC